jgi:hypothetical protein
MVAKVRQRSTMIALLASAVPLFLAEKVQAQCMHGGGIPYLRMPAMQVPPNPTQQITTLLTALQRQQRQLTLLTSLRQRRLTTLETGLPKQKNGLLTPLQQKQLTAMIRPQDPLTTAVQEQDKLLDLVQEQFALLVTPLQQQGVTNLVRQQSRLQTMLQQQRETASQLLAGSSTDGPDDRRAGSNPVARSQ